MSVKQVIAEIRKELDNFTAVRKWKEETGQKVIGWFPPDVPEELIAAAGALPVGISGFRPETRLAEAHLPRYVCSFMRGSLEMALRGELDFLDGVVFPHACDTKKHIVGLWERNCRFGFVHNLLFPRQLNLPSAQKYYRQEILRFCSALESFTGSKITTEKYQHIVAIYNQNRQLLREILRLQGEKQLLSNEDFYLVVMSSMLMPKTESNFFLTKLLNELTHGKGSQNMVPVVLSGSLVETNGFLKILDNCRLIAVGDDLYTGYRYFCLDVDGEDMLGGLTKRHFNQIPYSGYYSERHQKSEFLASLATERRAAGIIFIHLMFCEQENYEYPEVKQYLDRKNIPSIRIELDYQTQAWGQLSTRLQSFAEMLGVV
ncbi:MAG: 2-hydroxyacyl-CoA dehydratase family protein [Armatimonadetes bacterium]|nr:2-hydroxyacyl-CoA dehydratase family protein [Armatimonadota bacterium]